MRHPPHDITGASEGGSQRATDNARACTAARPRVAHAVSAACETRATAFDYRRAMVDRFPGMPFSFGALRKTFGPLYLRCDICRRFGLRPIPASAPTRTRANPRLVPGRLRE